MLTTVQIYQSEIAPPEVRGRMIAVQLVTINSAGQIIAFTGFGTYHVSNPALQWRLPVALQCVPAIALFIGGFFIPFSPRWLAMKGRHEEARKVLRRLHDDHANPLFWEREYAQMVAQLEHERRETAGVNSFHMFTNWRELHRALLAVVGLTSLQTNGAQTIFIFQSILYASLGYSTGKILLMACFFQLLCIVGGIGNILAIDWLGRRILMMSGLIGLSVVLGAFMACVAEFEKTGNTAWGKAGVAMVMIYIWFYGVTYISTGYAYAAEVLPTKIRAQGMALGMLCAYVCIIIFRQVTPIAYAEVSYRYVSLFIAFNMFFLPIIYFFCHETKGLTLEEINGLFGEEVQRTIDEDPDGAVHDKSINVEEKETVMV
ncbi:uncharacterized protein A1O5_09389 [Cladophialophora psammophila CBS 110553]|uniref:Major facilitator superfamily (MFS) profile domain-containing protein n=1 Tax=Cladophialophora psammophila CBS 110553 TaxID=1182543 RepID=W9WRW3_9EURO|nr:uncharacterized protein A1O5_09389 [Cladophialophora psammophila CBS 110553]EXJ67376.1 hypothetical protein A1O5_09389 [Cladophialophora psammophila CBS 110553]